MMLLLESRILWKFSVHYLLDSMHLYSATHSRTLKVELVYLTFEDILVIHSEGYKRCRLHCHFHLEEPEAPVGCLDAHHTLFWLFHEDDYKLHMRDRTLCLVHSGIETLSILAFLVSLIFLKSYYYCPCQRIDRRSGSYMAMRENLQTDS